MNTQFEYYIGSLEDFLSQARTINDNSLIKIQLAPSTLPGYFDYTHVLDNFAIRHIFTKHASDKEVLRGQIKIEDDDILLLPSLLNNYDNFHMEVMPGGRTLIHYRKTIRTVSESILKRFGRDGTNWPESLISNEKGNSPAQRVELRNFRICFLSIAKICNLAEIANLNRKNLFEPDYPRAPAAHPNQHPPTGLPGGLHGER